MMSEGGWMDDVSMGMCYTNTVYGNHSNGVPYALAILYSTQTVPSIF